MLLTERLKEYKVLLASKSPRRRQLLEGCGIEFEVAEGREAEENYPPELAAAEVPQYLAELKGEAWADVLGERELLITADTVVIAGGQILGKPATREDAVRMLRLLSGAEHEVVTGVSLRTRDRMRSFSCSSKVVFRVISDEEIEYYVDNFRPYDKAGAYGIQEWIGYVAISGIEGSFYNVMGLPVQRLWVELDKFV